MRIKAVLAVMAAVTAGLTPARCETNEIEQAPLPPSREYVLDVVFKRFPGVEREKAMKLANDCFAPRMQRIEQLSRRVPQEAVDEMTDIIYEVSELLEIKAANPDLFEKRITQMQLEREAEQYVERARLSKGSKRKKALDMLKKTLDRAFEIKQEIIKMDLERMERDLEELKKLVNKRESRKSAIVDRRIKELLGKTAQTEW
jgi:hypothetical protein